MAWIKSDQRLRLHPKLADAARRLRVKPAPLAGHLHFLWWWALDYAEDGNLSRYSVAVIGEAAAWPRDPEEFVSVLVDCGFLDRDPLTIHDWWDFAGSLVEKRKKQRQRGTVPGQGGDGPALDKTREEKSREDKIGQEEVQDQIPPRPAALFAIDDHQAGIIGQLLHRYPGWAEGQGALTYGGLVRLMKQYGTRTVNDALEELLEHAPDVDRPHPYLVGVCRGSVPPDSQRSEVK